MNNKLKTALFALFLIPCILFITACSKTISLNEYQECLKQSATNYYQNFDGKNITINSKSIKTEKWTEAVNYGYNNDKSVECDFENVIENIQTIEFENNGSNKNIRITNITTSKESGKEENNEETGVVNFSNTEKTTEIVTFVQTSSNWFVYQSIEKKINDNKPTIQKKQYSYLSKTLYNEDISEILEDLDETIFEDAFFSSTSIFEMLSNNFSSEYFKDKNSFGYSYSLDSIQIENKSVTTINLLIQNNFENNLPNTMSVKATQNINTIVDAEKTNMVNTIYSELKIDYSSDQIKAPIDFDEATTLQGAPITPVQGLNIGM